MKPVTVEIFGVGCSVLLGEWTAPSPAMAALLQETERALRLERWAGSDPDPDHTSALAMAERMGGRVTSEPRPAPENEPGRVY